MAVGALAKNHQRAHFMSERTEWGKIDYYDEDMIGLGDSSSPDCNRVLTIMFSSEY